MMEYTESERRMRADRATLLLNDDLFAEILTMVRQDAQNELGTVDPDDKTGIIRQQAVILVTGEIRDMLMACILASGQRSGGMSAEVSSKEG